MCQPENVDRIGFRSQTRCVVKRLDSHMEFSSCRSKIVLSFERNLNFPSNVGSEASIHNERYVYAYDDSYMV